MSPVANEFQDESQTITELNGSNSSSTSTASGISGENGSIFTDDEVEDQEVASTSSIEFELDSDSTVSVLSYLSENHKSERGLISTTPAMVTRNSDKAAIIRLNGELLKAKRSKWEVVDALTNAYDDMRALRKREERLNNVMTENTKKLNITDRSQNEKAWNSKGTEIRILSTQLEIKGDELFKARSNIKTLMMERDKMKEDLMKSKSELTVLSLRDGRKESEMALARSNLRTLTSSLNEANETLLNLRESTYDLENELHSKKSELERAKEQRDQLKSSLQVKEKEVSLLNKKLQDLGDTHLDASVSLSEREQELEKAKAEGKAVLKEIEFEVAEEMRKSQQRLAEVEARHEQDTRTIAEMSSKLQEWERVSESTNASIRESNAKQTAAKQQVAQYIDTLERELGQLRLHRQRSRLLDTKYKEYAKTTSSYNEPKPRPPFRKQSFGRKLPDINSSKKKERINYLDESLSDSSFSGTFRDGCSNGDSNNVPSDTDSEVSYSRKGHRRTLPLTPSDIEALSDSPSKESPSSEGVRGRPRETGRYRRRNTEDSGFGESLRAVGGKNVHHTGTYAENRNNSRKHNVVFAAHTSNSCHDDSPLDDSDEFNTVTPLSQDTGVPSSTPDASDMSDAGKKSTVATRRGKSPTISLRRYLSVDRLRARRRHVALILVFRYLSPLELCRVAKVCREWRSLSEHPSLWRRIVLVNTAVNNMSLLAMSRRCRPLEVLVLKGLAKAGGIPREDKNHNLNNCYLENGLECILKVASASLQSLHVEDCGELLTDRCLLLAGSHCRQLRSMTYISDKFPACPEALWSLWNCRDLVSLRVPPMVPCDHPNRFNDKSCETVANCWPGLRKLGVGGPGITIAGLIHIAHRCLRLQELEIDRAFYVTEEAAYGLCLQGLKGLRALSFTFTPVSPTAIKHFYSACPRLEHIAVHVGISDYFTDIHNPENIHKYRMIIKNLKALKKENADLAGVLRIKADYG